MNTFESRRKFLRNLGAASAGVLLTNVSFAGNRPSLCNGRAVRNQQEVLTGIKCYGEEIELINSLDTVGVGSSHDTPVHILVKVSDQDRLISFFQNPKGLPFHNVHVQDNNLTFCHHSQKFLVENLSPTEFAKRVKQVRRTSKAVG